MLVHAQLVRAAEGLGQRLEGGGGQAGLEDERVAPLEQLQSAWL